MICPHCGKRIAEKPKPNPSRTMMGFDLGFGAFFGTVAAIVVAIAAVALGIWGAMRLRGY